MNDLLVAGVGSELRGDDAAGLLAVRALRSMAPPGVDIEEHSGDPARLADSIGRHRLVIIVDAVSGPGAPGAVHGFDPTTLAGAARLSSHGGGVVEAVRLARVLAGPSSEALRVWIVGIAGADFALGAPPGRAVELAAREVARGIATWIREVALCA